MAHRNEERDRRRDYDEDRSKREPRFENREDWRYFGERDRERHYGREEDRADWGQKTGDDWMSYGRPYEYGDEEWRNQRENEGNWNYGRERGFSRGRGWGDYGRDYDRNWDRGQQMRGRRREGWAGYEYEYDPERDRRQMGGREDWNEYNQDFNRSMQGQTRGQRESWGGYDRGETGWRNRQGGRRGFENQGLERDYDREYGRGYDQGYGRTFGRGGRWEEDYDDMDITNPYEDDDTGWVYTEVWTIEGPFSGVGPMGYQRSDDRIFEDVCERLTQHGQVDARDIEVDVRDGEVTLKGSVNDRRTKRLAEDVVATVPGVWDVHNNLRMNEEQRGRGQFGQRQQQQMGTGMTDRKNQIRTGMRVYGSDNKEIGEVKEKRERDFLVDRTMQRDVYIPYDACTRVSENHITINIPADQVNDQNWPAPEILEGSERDNK